MTEYELNEKGYCMNNPGEQQYLDTLEDVLLHGVESGDRTGIGTYRLFSQSMVFNIESGKRGDNRYQIPILTTKYVWHRAVWTELCWFLKGDTNIEYLKDHGVDIWDEWADDDGELGPVYGRQLRSFPTPDGDTIDQLERVCDNIEQNPYSRRHVFTMWNPGELDDMHLAPCFTGDTLVATQKGYKKIKNIDLGEKVLTNTGQMKGVTKTWKTQYEGKMINLRTNYSHDYIKCTPNHEFLVKGRGWLESDKIMVGDMIAIPRNKKSKVPDFKYRYDHNLWDTEVNKDFELKPKDYYTLGYFLGDGWCDHKEGKWSVYFAINDAQKEKILSKIRNTIKVAPQPNSGENVTKYKTQSKKWIRVFREFGHLSHNKKIPQWVIDSPKKHINQFIEGYLDADGCVRPNGEVKRFTTTSEELALGLQRIFAKKGKVLSIHKNEKSGTTEIEGREVNERDLYNLNVRDERKSAEVDEEYVWIRVQDKKESKNDDSIVYNLAVKEDHTYTSLNFVNHNCHGTAIQLHVEPSENDYKEDKLSMSMYQRSGDLFLGVPFNITSYCALLTLIAIRTGLRPNKFYYTIGDAHIYKNHTEQVIKQLRQDYQPYPLTKIQPQIDFEDYEPECFKVTSYRHGPKIEAPVAV